MTMRSILLLLIALALCSAGRAEVYRWTGADGKPHFGDKPPVGAAGVESFKGGGGVSFMGGGNVSEKKASAKVRLFVTQSCPYCKKAKAYLNQRGTPFEELDIETSLSAKKEYQKFGGNGVPVILVGQERMNGFDAEGLESLLVGAGL